MKATPIDMEWGDLHHYFNPTCPSPEDCIFFGDDLLYEYIVWYEPSLEEGPLPEMGCRIEFPLLEGFKQVYP